MRSRLLYFMQNASTMACFVLSCSAFGIKHRPHTSLLKTNRNLSVLHKSEIIKFPIYAPRATSAQNHCDPSGNIFLLFAPNHANPFLNNANQVFATPDILNHPVHELKIYSQEIVAFGGPELSNLYYQPGSFAVDNSGHVYRMLDPNDEFSNKNHPEDIIIQYDSDGSYDSKIRIPAPHHWEFDAGNFIVLNGGNYLITGMLHPRLKPQSYGQRPIHPFHSIPYMAIFDEQGNLISAIHLPGDHEAGAKHSIFWPRVVFSTLMASGPHDTAYLLRPSGSLWLYTLNSDGKVLHEVKVDTSQFPNAQLLSMSTMGNSQLLLQFFSANMDARHAIHPVSIFAVVNAITGHLVQAYRMPKNRGAMFACASDPHHIEYLGASHKGKMEVSIYSSH